MKRIFVPVIVLVLLSMTFMACDENATDPEAVSQPGTVTFNITAPYMQETSGKPIEVSVWANLGDDLPIASQSGIVSDSIISISIADVEGGSYVVTAAIDIDNNGFGGSVAGEGDLVWAALDILVDGDVDVTISQYGWTFVDGPLVAFGVRGIPDGNAGEILALGVFEDGADITIDTVETIFGGVGLVYGSTAVIFAMDTMSDSGSVRVGLPSGNYDVYALVDLDGDLNDWFGMDSYGPPGDPMTNGDLIASYDLAYNAATDNGILFNATFEVVQAYLLSFNITAPTGQNLNDVGVMTVLMHDFNQEFPSAVEFTSITNGTATSTLSVLTAGTYSFAVIVDASGTGFGDPENPTIDMGDLVWGAAGVSITADMNVTVGGDAWQYYHSMIVSVDDIPVGHDGEVFAVAMLPDGRNPLEPYMMDVAMTGAGLIYGNSAFIALHPEGDFGNPTWALPTGNYDIWCLVDVDGVLADYDRQMGDSTAFNPSTVGDWYVKYDYVYDTSFQSGDDFIQINGIYEQLVGITGTVSCPPWTSAGGNIFLYLFRDNPILNDSAEVYSYTVLTQPGAYSMPCFPGDSVIVSGFWDVDSSGEWNGPTQAVDYIGGYGPAMDSLTFITCLSTGVANIDFTISDLFDSTLYGP